VRAALNGNAIALSGCMGHHTISRMLVTVALVLGTTARAQAAEGTSDCFTLDVRAFRPVDGPSSGPEVYYRVVDTADGAVLQGSYRPGMQSVTMGLAVPDRSACAGCVGPGAPAPFRLGGTSAGAGAAIPPHRCGSRSSAA
jgi:hypothetical protein